MTKIKQPRLFGLLAQFADADETIAAAQRVRAAGYRAADAYSPYPVEGLAEALGFAHTPIAAVVLACGILGGLTGFTMCWYANVINYPLNIGGRPHNSWPAWIPITFELTVLFAGLSALVSMLILNRLPELYHPLFNAEAFRSVTRNGFFICIEARDAKFDLTETKTFLESLHPRQVMEVLG